jgi:hypothetical protein
LKRIASIEALSADMKAVAAENRIVAIATPDRLAGPVLIRAIKIAATHTDDEAVEMTKSGREKIAIIPPGMRHQYEDGWRMSPEFYAKGFCS